MATTPNPTTPNRDDADADAVTDDDADSRMPTATPNLLPRRKVLATTTERHRPIRTCIGCRRRPNATPCSAACSGSTDGSTSARPRPGAVRGSAARCLAGGDQPASVRSGVAEADPALLRLNRSCRNCKRWTVVPTASRRDERIRTKERLIRSVAKNIRVHELAKELGMTNAEAVELSVKLGVPVKSHSSSLNEAYADMVRRRAIREGLTRPEQPEEPKPAKKARQEGRRQGGDGRQCRRGRRRGRTPAVAPLAADVEPTPSPKCPSPPSQNPTPVAPTEAAPPEPPSRSSRSRRPNRPSTTRTRQPPRPLPRRRHRRKATPPATPAPARRPTGSRL